MKIRNLDRVGEILQAAIGVRSNNVYELTFSIEDPTLLKQQVRKLAIEDALARAEVMATADVPIQPPGEVDLVINLQVVFEIR